MGVHAFKLPDIGEGVVEGEVVAWHVKEGDEVREDDPIVDVMTDKANVTIPSPVTGSVLKTVGGVGEIIAVGTGKRTEDGKVLSLEVRKGDRVLFGKYSGTEIKLEGEERVLLREDEILAIVER